ncbi:MAG: ribonucleoside triphosphate reductase, partial [Ruminococcaceae bacterium]|nr:ribonucleoside triphosphate reductase [Oscillospiraceae bacterium]
SDYQEMYGDLYNLEATPAESTAYRLAKHDRKRYPDIICASEGETPYYTNSSHLPVGYTADVFTALDVQDELQTLYTSGTVFHAFLGERLPDWKAAATLVRKIAENYRLPYYSLSPTYSVCREHGYLAGEQFTCPHCGKEAEVYSRITGYYRPVKNWNAGKSQEYKERKVYDISSSVLTHCGPKEAVAVEAAPVAEEKPLLADGVYLFASKTCPKCKVAESLLGKSDIAYEKLFAEDNVPLFEALKIKQAPTLVKVSGGEIAKFVGLPEVKAFLQANG